MQIRQIVSGGQTGADRAALDVALELGIEHAGWVPKELWAEDGPIDLTRYANLRESNSPEPSERTELNVRDSEATLLLSHGPLQGGSLLTLTQARARKKPWLHIDLDRVAMPDAVDQIQQWLTSHRIGILNIAGPRQSEDSRIYAQVKLLLSHVLVFFHDREA